MKKPTLAFLISFVILFQPLAPVFAEPTPSRPKVRQAFFNFSELARKEAMSPRAPGSSAPTVHEHPTMPDEMDRGGMALPGASPAPARVLQPAPSPAPMLNFQALGDNNTAIPPDTHGTAGRNHLMTTLNSQVRIQTRAGAEVSTLSLGGFWSAVLSPDPTDVFDPKVHYDPFENRFITVACSARSSASSSLLIAVSIGDDPTGGWFALAVDGDATDTTWVDYPNLGFNKNWIAVSVNMFNNVGNAYSSTKIYLFDKANLYGGGAGTVATSPIDMGSFGSVIMPALTLDNTQTTLYVANVHSLSGGAGGVGQIKISRITGTVSNPGIDGGTIVNSSLGSWTASAPDADANGKRDNSAPQLGSATPIDAGDHRVLGLVYRDSAGSGNGSLWMVHTAFVGTPLHSVVHWYQYATAPIAEVQAGRIGSETIADYYYAWPSIGVDKFDDVLIGYSRFGATQYASGNYSFRFGSDPAGTMRDDAVLKAGEAPYAKVDGAGRNRWGDYSNTVIDPLNDSSFWTIQEYAASPVGGIDRWGTWWGQIVPTNLVLSFTPDKNRVGIRQTLTYTASIRNDGSRNYTGVTLTSTLTDPVTTAFPVGLSIESVTPSQGTCSGSAPISCNLGTIPAGATASATIVVRPTLAGSIKNEAAITAVEVDGNALDNTASITTTVNPVTTVYPNPWRPGATSGDFASATGPCGTGMIFDSLPADSTIRIYNMQGDLVRDYTVSSADPTSTMDSTAKCKAWDGKNDSGSIVASGVYFALIKRPSGGEEKRKIAIEK